MSNDNYNPYMTTTLTPSKAAGADGQQFRGNLEYSQRQLNTASASSCGSQGAAVSRQALFAGDAREIQANKDLARSGSAAAKAWLKAAGVSED